MTVEELIEILERLNQDIPLHVCHYARRAGKNKPMIRPLVELRWIDGKLCLVEADDRKLYLADR